MAIPTPALRLSKGEILFKEGDVAASLFIIKKGKLRLYKEKGDGVVDIAVLRAGEVFGEMSYFDNDSGRRNCSASSINDLEYVEVAFSRFNKMMKDLSPWFETIIRTLVDRLKKSNQRIKSLDSSSVVDYSTLDTGSTSLKIVDFTKILSTLYLCIKAYGELVSHKYSITKKVFYMFAKDIYNINEVKTEEVLEALNSIGIILLIEQNNKKIIMTDQLEEIRSMFLSFNAEKNLIENKKLKLSHKGFLLLNHIWIQIENQSSQDDFIKIEISEILNSLKKDYVTVDDFSELRVIGFVKSVLVESGSYSVSVHHEKVKKHINFLKLKNYFHK